MVQQLENVRYNLDFDLEPSSTATPHGYLHPVFHYPATYSFVHFVSFVVGTRKTHFRLLTLLEEGPRPIEGHPGKSVFRPDGLFRCE